MARDEDESQQVVTDFIVEGCINVFHLDLAGPDLAGANLLNDALTSELLVLALETCVAAEVIDRAMLGGSHKPGTRVVRDARFWPLLERRHESILCEVFGNTNIAHDSRQPGYEAR
jgi:hypothetical protein